MAGQPTSPASPLANLAEAGFAVALTIIGRIAVGAGFPGYDSTWALVWGDQIARGELPTYDVPAGPTPHPLANAIAIVLTPLPPDAAVAATVLLSWAALAALVWGVLRLGDALFGRPTGALAATLVATRALVPELTAQSFVDVPFLALVVWAAALEARRPRRGTQVGVLLLLAGLLRPEAWPIALLYGCWCLPTLHGAARVRMAALVVAAPLLWATGDLIVTGEPLFSLHGTQTLSAELGRPRGLGTAIKTAPDHLLHAVQGPAGRVGVLGIVVALVLHRSRAALPLVLLGLGLGAYFVLGVAGLPLLERYLLIPSIMLTVFAAAAAVAWSNARSAPPRRRVWRGFGAATALLLLLGVPGDLDRLEEARARLQPQRDVRQDLIAATRSRGVRQTITGCNRIRVAPFWRPHVLHWLEGRASTQDVGDFRGGDATLTFFYAHSRWSASRRSDLVSPRIVYSGTHFTVVADRC